MQRKLEFRRQSAEEEIKAKADDAAMAEAVARADAETKADADARAEEARKASIPPEPAEGSGAAVQKPGPKPPKASGDD